ncbi:MAG TPA: peptidylprolyl isomerase, partial [Gemmatimonadales bacterium]|nr:peptidylprolyl isomerase [Gemmatimonadales bacterium]
TLARLDPSAARARVARLATHRVWQVRMYATRAAVLLADTALLRRMTGDQDGNVAEAAIEALSVIGRHAEDATYLRALRSTKPQVVRAAATALKGSPRTDVALAAGAVYGRWRSRRVDSERDARLALLELMGRPASEDVRRKLEPLPREVVDLALGAHRDLTVQLGAKPHDTFVVRLRGDIAPITAARVLQLADRGYYRGTTWHRVIPDFVIQGGGHGASEYVGGDRFFRDELGNLSHLRGGVGMSTRGHDTGDGQWFIDLSDLPRLDRDYTLFGEVVAGMEVVDAVLEGDRIESITRSERVRWIR